MDILVAEPTPTVRITTLSNAVYTGYMLIKAKVTAEKDKRRRPGYGNIPSHDELLRRRLEVCSICPAPSSYIRWTDKWF